MGSDIVLVNLRISPDYPAAIAMKPGVVIAVNLFSLFRVPKGFRVGFKSSHDLYFRVDDSHVEPRLGFWVKPDESYMSFEPEWYKDHNLYMVSEFESIVTFEVIPDKQL